MKKVINSLRLYYGKAVKNPDEEDDEDDDVGIDEEDDDE